MGDGRIVGDEPMIEVGKAKERSHILNFSWGWPCGNAVKFHWIHGKLTGFHDHSEVFDFRDVKLAFFELQVKVEFSHALEDTMGSFSMGFGVRGGDEEVVYIDDKPSFSDHVLEGIIHKSLERGRRVAKAEEHDGWFKEPFMDDESRFPLMAVFDVNVIIPLANIELSKVVSIFQLVHKVGDKGEWIGITGGVFIKVVVVLAGAEFSVLLLDKEERGCLGRIGRTNLPCG